LIAAAASMYFAAPAAEYVLGGRDPGVYVNEGVQIAQSQSLATTDRMAAAVPAATRDLFFPSYLDPNYYSVRFMGFHLRDPVAGTVTGQFPQGYPIWVALAYGIDGITGTRRVIAWWAVLGILTVYFAARRLIGPLPAAAAAGLLSVHVIQTWYARYPNSEIVTQALLFAALLAHAYAHEDEDRFFGPIAASLLGLALFTRFPVVFAVGGAVAASLLAPVSGHRVRGNHFGRFSDEVLGGSDNHTAIYVNGSADDVDIGGLDPSERNSIAGHPDPVAGAGYGVHLGGSGQGHLVAGNLIGTFPNGNEAHGNRVGIRIDGDLGVVMQNLISGNVTGVQLLGNDNIVASNRIGVKAFAFCLPIAALVIDQGATSALVHWVCATGATKTFAIVPLFTLAMTVAGAVIASAAVVSYRASGSQRS
jgi:hypothetical protein